MPRITTFVGKAISGKTLGRRLIPHPPFIPTFGSVANSFMNSFSGDKKYIDITNGSDSNDGDTDSTAYQTLGYAQAQTAAISTAVMYVIKPGVYTLTPVTVGPQSPQFTTAGLSDGNLPRTFFCAAGQVVFQWTATTAERDATMINLQNINSAVYGAILKRNNNGKSNAYSVGMFNGSTAHSQGDFYNCVFQETNANGNWSLQYDNSQVNTSVVNNCSFYVNENGINDYAGGANLVLNNCAFRYVWGTSNSTRNNTITAQTMDDTTYELAANNNTNGVYSGTYAWGESLWATVAPEDYYLTTGNVTITGESTLSSTLTASNNLADGDGLSNISYQWRRDGVAITGATATTYTLVEADVDAVITVTVSYKEGQGKSGSVTSLGTDAITAAQAPSTVSYLVVAGGGSGGWQGGGGGGGGYLSGTSTPSVGTVYSIVVGGGAAARVTGNRYPGYRGGVSSGFNISASGGGGGGSYVSATHPWRDGTSGGSGGGACGQASNAVGGGGTSGQGNAGGSVTGWSSSRKLSRGGGGAGAAAASGSAYTGMNGGVGKNSLITGINTGYAGGGGGNNSQTTARYGGGTGGGGTGGANNTGVSGGVNLGGGGGGGMDSGAGGSGVVIISYPDTFGDATVTGNPTVTIAGGNKIYKFTSSGSITW